MLLFELATNHNLDHDNAKAFLLEWLKMQKPIIYLNKEALKKDRIDFCTYTYKHADTDNFKARYRLPLIAVPTDLGE